MMRLNIKKGLISLFLILVSLSLVRSISKNLQRFRRVKTLRQETAELKEENEELKNKLETRSDLGYVEEQARKILGMVKEGEKVYIFPDSNKEESALVTGDSPEVDIYYWREWARAFGF